MIKQLRALVGLANREDALTVELAPSIPAAEAELASARAALEAAKTNHRAGLLNPDDAALQQLDVACADAQRRVDRAVALIETLRERLADAEARESEAERVERYQAARAQADDARRTLGEWYVTIATDMVNLIELVARAEVEVQRVNNDLPRGAEPLQGVEHEVRDLPGVPDQVVSEKTVKRWVKVGQIIPGNDDQSNVYETVKGQRGVFMVPSLPLPDCTECELRTFTEQQIQPGASRSIAYKLAQRVALPGFRPGDGDLWTPVADGTKAEEIVRRVEQLRFYRPADAAPKPLITKLVPEPGAKRVMEIPKPAPTMLYRDSYGGR